MAVVVVVMVLVLAHHSPEFIPRKVSIIVGIGHSHGFFCGNLVIVAVMVIMAVIIVAVMVIVSVFIVVIVSVFVVVIVFAMVMASMSAAHLEYGNVERFQRTLFEFKDILALF